MFIKQQLHFNENCDPDPASDIWLPLTSIVRFLSIFYLKSRVVTILCLGKRRGWGVKAGTLRKNNSLKLEKKSEKKDYH